MPPALWHQNKINQWRYTTLLNWEIEVDVISIVLQMKCVFCGMAMYILLPQSTGQPLHTPGYYHYFHKCMDIFTIVVL